MALQYLISERETAVPSTEVRDLESLDPPPLNPARTVSILVITLQSLAVSQGPLHTFREWYRRAISVSPREPRWFIPTIQYFFEDGSST